MNDVDTQDVSVRALPGPPKVLLSSTTFLLKRLGFAAKDRSHAAFEGTGLSALHFAVLALLEEDPRETQAMIADALLPAAIVRLLDGLRSGPCCESGTLRSPPPRGQADARGPRNARPPATIMRRLEDDFSHPGRRAAGDAVRCLPR
jgi:hypothetical protein